MKRKYYKSASKNKIIITALGALAGFFITLFLIAYVLLNQKPSDTADLKVRIPTNKSISAIVKILNTQGMLKPNWFFELTAKSYAFTTKKTIQAGYHKFNEKMTNYEILKALFSGDNMSYRKVTFPEGLSLKRYAEILNKELGLNKAQFLKLCAADSLLKKYGIRDDSFEGYFMPATYNFFKDIEPEEVIKTLVENANDIWNERFAGKAKQVGKSRREVLTMASIVEGEAPVEAERPKVAGVYYNRLRKGMLLQADPTVQYAVGGKKRLLYVDLEVDSPYNTYKYKGLPPGPINSPSTSSIEAALAPAKHDYIYFVAVGDGSGLHNFARNFQEHQVFIAKYKKALKN